MKFYPTGKQARQIDKYTQDVIGIPGLVLMEKAAEFAVSVIKEFTEDSVLCRDHKLFNFYNKRDKILAIAEGGNNGGDAVAVARILKTMGYDTYVYEVNGINKKTDSYLKQVSIAEKLGVKFVTPDIESENAFADYRIIIDGIFGVGLTREVQGIQKKVIERINEAGENRSFVLGIDIPSGISSDSGEVLGAAVKCDATATFQYIKAGMLEQTGRDFAGEIFCGDIGLVSADSISEYSSVVNESALCAVDRKSIDVADKNSYIRFESSDEETDGLLPERNPSGNKGTFGKVLVVAGSKDIYGALYFATSSAYKAGAGLVKVVTDVANRALLMDKLPELMMLTYDGSEVTESGAADKLGKFIEEFKISLGWADVVLLGPGLGTSDFAKMLLDVTATNVKKGQYVVLDADALNIISEMSRSQDERMTIDYLLKLSEKLGDNHVVITPHLMEMSRLVGQPVSYIKENKEHVAVSVSQTNKIISVLKDARTVVACYREEASDAAGIPVYINTTGNSGMAKGGSGDVLAGVISGILAEKGGNAFDKVCYAVNRHGTAGDMAKEEMGERNMTPQDLISYLEV